MSNLSVFERQVLDACLAGDDPKLRVLRLQADAATVTAREHTSCGAYIDLCVADTVPLLDAGAIILGDVNLEIKGVAAGLATLLYVREGKIQFLELATYDDSWPEEPELLAVGYLQEVQVSPGTYSLVPVKDRHPETLARALQGGNPQGAA